jgi:hypothetical protein
MNRTFGKIWGAPLLLALLTLFGLLSALLGTGVWHFLSWFTLAVPLLVISWYLWKAFPGRVKKA